jgi:hypothetical protein
MGSNAVRTVIAVAILLMLCADVRARTLTECGKSDGYWSELNGTTWMIPAARYKTNLDHVIPLSALALAALPRRNGEFVFTGNGRQAIGG